MAEIFRALTDSIWKELPAASAKAAKTKLAVSTIRRNLQREHVARLVRIVLGPRHDLSSFFSDLIYFGFEAKRRPTPAPWRDSTCGRSMGESRRRWRFRTATR